MSWGYVLYSVRFSLCKFYSSLALSSFRFLLFFFCSTVLYSLEIQYYRTFLQNGPKSSLSSSEHFLQPYLLSAIGRLCEKCDGKCVICDSYVRPCTLVRICDECNYGSYQGRCVICGGPGVSDAYYCKECTIQEKDVRIPPIVCTLTNFHYKLNILNLFPSERRMSENSQLGKLKNGSFLRKEEIRIQKKIITFSI